MVQLVEIRDHDGERMLRSATDFDSEPSPPPSLYAHVIRNRP
jgi:hypothetical protein